MRASELVERLRFALAGSTAEQERALLRAAVRMRKHMPEVWAVPGDTERLKAARAWDKAVAALVGGK